MIDPARKTPETFFEHEPMDIETVGKIIDLALFSVMGKGSHQREDIIVPYSVFVIILVIAAKDVSAVFCEADHAVQYQLACPAAYIERNVIFLQSFGLRREGHLIIFAVQHREHA